MILAIHHSSSIVFEGVNERFSAIDPQPHLSEVFSCSIKEGKPEFSQITPNFRTLFREDSFDPTSRIRRGRIYEHYSAYPHNQIYADFGRFPSPFTPSSAGQKHNNEFEFYTNYSHNNLVNMKRISVIFLGGGDFITPWRIVDMELLFTRETLFTLKSMSTLGTLPELIEEKLPPEKKKEIQEGFEKVVDVAPIQIAESVVDVSREFARLLLAAWLPTIGVADTAKDLGKLVNKVPKDRVAIANAASVINRLHPRGKSSERECQAGKGQEIRSLSNEDASLAVSLIGFLLRDFGWAA